MLYQKSWKNNFACNALKGKGGKWKSNRTPKYTISADRHLFFWRAAPITSCVGNHFYFYEWMIGWHFALPLETIDCQSKNIKTSKARYIISNPEETPPFEKDSHFLFCTKDFFTCPCIIVQNTQVFFTWGTPSITASPIKQTWSWTCCNPLAVYV